MDELQRYLDSVTPARRRRDAGTLLDLVSRVTGQPPRMWGTIVGFGEYHYRYGSGREGSAPAAGFAARKAASTIYLADGVAMHGKALDRLGPHTTGVGCLYIKDLGSVDLAVLESIIARSYRRSPPAPGPTVLRRAAAPPIDVRRSGHRGLPQFAGCAAQIDRKHDPNWSARVRARPAPRGRICRIGPVTVRSKAH
jgi:hypothetical protein